HRPGREGVGHALASGRSRQYSWVSRVERGKNHRLREMKMTLRVVPEARHSGDDGEDAQKVRRNRRSSRP
ncbi:MAG: hypothetical protein WHT46_07450, partial [Candidatus Geothermincolales bacterium]